MRKRKHSALHDNQERWLLTYADLITLLLAFFIVMYSMSRIDAKKFGAMTSALTGALKGVDLAQRERDMNGRLSTGGPLKTGELRLMQRQLQQKVGDAGMSSTISSDVTERGLVISVKDATLFDQGKADLNPGALAVLHVIGHEIRNVANHLRVEGHTDPRPINTPRFPSNWELSTARATSVLRFLIDSTGCAPQRISALGFGEYRPVAINDTPEHMAQNRRVDIVLLSQRMSLSEPEAVADPRDSALAKLNHE
jgi:chemotaxis protein MotB